ncbi:methionyl aminopeptidase [Mumia flava]|uniref:Methionine aminopeptidase n=1 Tax=Mumia flava TaxID=1348852 RepID=A0A0B2BK44_9ACTN|nr:type I methionyl aminopeptidase [Mumia flava]PJJ58368.1 methionyl aminopeptidase [Mumia flava]
MGLFGSGLELKSPDQVAVMRRAGLIVADALAAVRDALRPGVTTGELDALAEDLIRSRGAAPNFKGYHGFPGTICTSVNDEVVHGIPGDRVIADGDLVSIDCGCVLEGWHSDSAITVAVGDVSESRRELLRVCEESLWRGIAAARLGGRVGDIGSAIEQYVRSQPGGESYGIVEDYVGHGIGTAMHMAPNVPNVAAGGRGPKLVEGLVLAVEPMITEATIETTVLDDDWTVVTDDGGWAAHFEHSFTLTRTGAWVLSAHDGGRARLEALGVAYGGPDAA